MALCNCDMSRCQGVETVQEMHISSEVVVSTRGEDVAQLPAWSSQVSAQNEHHLSPTHCTRFCFLVVFQSVCLSVCLSSHQDWLLYAWKQSCAVYCCRLCVCLYVCKFYVVPTCYVVIVLQATALSSCLAVCNCMSVVYSLGYIFLNKWTDI